MSNDKGRAIRDAFNAANSRRPYARDDALVVAATPHGGDWHCEVREGKTYRSVVWRSTEVARIDPSDDLGRHTAGDIAMAVRAMPLLDGSLRAILVLAEKPENLATIRELAASVIAFVEMPAPTIKAAEEEDASE